MIKMEISLKGVTRIVFLVGNYAIKIPNFRYEHQHFLQGCYANWSEYSYSKRFKNHKNYKDIAPTIFCTWFGLLAIQKRVKELDRPLTDTELEYFSNLTSDLKKENFGYLSTKDGTRLVCVDYV